jgi:hypothetical protein
MGEIIMKTNPFHKSACVYAAGLFLYAVCNFIYACPSINAITNFLPAPSSLGLTATITDNGTGTATYGFSANDQGAVGGIPGLIEYCIYPLGGLLPDTATASAIGDNGSPWQSNFASAQGYFSFIRPNGDPSNVPFNAATSAGITMGTATWYAHDPGTGLVVINPITGLPVPGSVPVNAPPLPLQTILMHINDSAVCAALYGGTSSTCFVYPSTGTTPPPPLCNGAPACKQAVIDQAITTVPLTVPAFTPLRIHYTYVIINQATNHFNMIFYPPAPSTKDINTGGGKDYFGCEQIPLVGGQPGGLGSFLNYQGTLFTMNFMHTGGSCDQSRFTLLAPQNGTITLHPGESVTFTVDMTTRKNKGGNQEYTSCGPKVLNSGFTVKWIQSDDLALHSYATLPITIFAVGC